MSKTPIIPALANSLSEEGSSVTECLRKARLVAARLGLDETTGAWIERELKGYAAKDQVPEYRLVTGELQALNPVRGWQPVFFQDASTAGVFSRLPIGSPFATIEEDARRSKGQHYVFGLTPEQKSVEAVRGLLTDWCLTLEKAGIHGDNLEFSEPERKAAPMANNNFIIQNSTIGNVIGTANYSSIAATLTTPDNVAAIRNLASQIKQQAGSLPDGLRDEVVTLNEQLETEVERESPDGHRLAGMLSSLRKIVESATGNLAAQGILAMLKAFLGRSDREHAISSSAGRQVQRRGVLRAHRIAAGGGALAVD